MAKPKVNSSWITDLSEKKKKRKQKKKHKKEAMKVKRSRALWSFLPTSSACLLSVEKFQPKNKFNQRRENAETKENSPARLNNNSLVIKQSQGPLVPSRGL